MRRLLTLWVVLALWGAVGINGSGADTRPYSGPLFSLFPLSSSAVGERRGPGGGERFLSASKIAPFLARQLEAGGEVEFFIRLREQADLSGFRDFRAAPAKAERGRYVYDQLRRVAQRSQEGLVRWLDARGVAYRRFYIVNMILVRGNLALAEALAARPDVERLEANPTVRAALPRPRSQVESASAEADLISWGVSDIQANQVWSLYGVRGQGIVVAGNDTGVDWDHPALKPHYRGWNGTSADHNYNWHDAIHGDIGTPNSNPCGYNLAVPCDDDNHGTHTLGTMIGDDGAGNQIGVAPGAQWIGCRNMDNGDGNPASYAECFEFFLAPYPIGGNPLTDGRPDLAPDVINNSWGCPPSEGCAADTLKQIVETVRAAGILVVASAGNSGPACGSVKDPPALYDASFSVGAYEKGIGNQYTIAGFSSRGPVTIDGSGRIKPDLAAPGVNIRSSIRGTGYQGGWSGTSMAAPHVAGAAALLWSADPSLRGDVASTELVLTQAAIPQIETICGGDADGQPNNVWGWGRLNARAALEQALPPGTLSGRVTNEITGAGLAGVRLTMQKAETGIVVTTTTDAAGFYTRTLLSGSYIITASLTGFPNATAGPLAVPGGGSATQDFVLSPLSPTPTPTPSPTPTPERWQIFLPLVRKQGR
jgi:serine protease AprX